MYLNTMALPVFKGFILLFVLQSTVDSYKKAGSPRRRSKDFTINNERLYHGKAKIPENSIGQHEQIRGFSSRGKTVEKSHRLAKLFKLEPEDQDEYGLNSLKISPRKHYHTFKSTRNEHTIRTSATAAQRSENVNKDYVFRDIVRTDTSNSYVAQAPKQHKGTKWYITSVSMVLVLLIVVALCVYAPCGCQWKRHRNEFDVSCPITASQKGMCGKCYLHRNATTKTMTYEERPHHVSVTMATNDSHHRQSSGNYSSQYTWAQGTQRPGKLKQAKSKVSSLFKGSRGGHLYEPAGYRYKPLKNTEKRESLTYEPEWTSIGAFLNKNQRSSTYGSTKDSERRFVDRYGRRSRDSLDAGDEVVEYALKLRPRRRQVIELREFPLGYSKSYLNIDLESDPGVVFDPYRDQLYRKKAKTSQRLTFSDSDLRKLSCTDKLGNYDESEDLFNAARPRKSSLKMGGTKGKTKAKVVQFFPSNFNYDAQFVQIPPKNKMAENKVGEFERNFNLSYRESRNDFKAVDIKASHESSFNPTKDGSNELMKLPEIKNKEFSFNDSKEHAVDCDIKSPSMEVTKDQNFIVQPRDCASSYVNYGCRSSTEVLTASREIPIVSQGSQAFHGDVEGNEKPAKNLESFSSSCTDLRKSDLNCKPEPLAGLLSPIRRAAHKRDSCHKGIVTSQAAGDLVCVTSYVQPLTSSKYTVPYGNSIYQPQPDNTTRFKSSQSQSDFEKDVWGMDKTSLYEPLQRFPEKESKKES
ncbi:uncharacterized protein LOC144628294 isoform X2 [Oculina patagonica]